MNMNLNIKKEELKFDFSFFFYSNKEQTFFLFFKKTIDKELMFAYNKNIKRNNVRIKER